MYCCVHRYLDCIQKHEKSISFSLFHSHNQCDGTQGTKYMHAYICKQLLIKYQRCRINYRKSEKRVPRNYSERTNWFINLNYYNELTELFEFYKAVTNSQHFHIEKYFRLSQNLESTCIYMYMYKYYFLNEKKITLQDMCISYATWLLLYKRHSVNRKKGTLIHFYMYSLHWSLEEDSDLTFEIKQIFVDILMVKYFLYQKVD